MKAVSPSIVPPVLPWRHTLILVGASLAVLLTFLIVQGIPAAAASIAGLTIGGFATVSSGRRGAVAGGVAGIAILTVSVLFPGPGSFAFIAAVAVLAAGFEQHKTGTRIAVALLLAHLYILYGQFAGGGVDLLFPMLVGLAVSYGAIAHLGLAGILPKRRLSLRSSIAAAAFLGLGFALSIALSLVIDSQRSYWIALIFVSRLIVPAGETKASIRRYAQGATVGVILAVGIEALGLPAEVRLMLALTAAVLSVRYTTHPLPVATAAITAAILLAAGATVEESLFRIEALAIVAVILAVVNVVTVRVWHAILGNGAAVSETDVTGLRR